MRSVDGYLSRLAQSRWQDALVTHADERDYQLDRHTAATVGLGHGFPEAKRALTALLAADRARNGRENP